MGNITAKVLADNDVPCRAMAPIKFFFDMCCDILLDIVYLESSVCDVDWLLLELFVHVYIFYDGFGTGRGVSNTTCGSLDGFGFNISHDIGRELGWGRGVESGMNRKRKNWEAVINGGTKDWRHVVASQRSADILCKFHMVQLVSCPRWITTSTKLWSVGAPCFVSRISCLWILNVCFFIHFFSFSCYFATILPPAAAAPTRAPANH